MKRHNGKVSLNRIGRMISNMPHGACIKSELKQKYKETTKLLKASKHKNANPEYFKPRVNANLMVLGYALNVEVKIKGDKNV